MHHKKHEIFRTSPKKSLEKTKNGENVPTLEVVEVVLVQCNLVKNITKKSLRCYILSHLTNPMLIY